MFWKQKKLAELHFEKKKHCINHVCILLRCIGACMLMQHWRL